MPGNEGKPLERMKGIHTMPDSTDPAPPATESDRSELRIPTGPVTRIPGNYGTTPYPVRSVSTNGEYPAWLTWFAVACFALAIFFAGVALGRLTTHPGPKPCPFNGGYVTSGDSGGRGNDQYVCTDGTWVHVTGYGG